MKLDDYLTANGLTEAVFADLVGVSQPHINRLRKGQSWPQKDLLERIREATGGKVTANDFLSSEAAA